ncbi:hypothetical protein FC99_GL000486 [Levilactobacillus koreensis JCM 16448]|uniref:Glucarate dehydratase n=1 Tax=Levilactobacillus koreensis TaxID=637971 RepID=A0AAC8ZG91_9LACO|nr:hypothetical protein [Levilactobacillus koreensis]AKP64258.1 hypothetical protein ABN16_04105 [Levilactobacillus koreensis]KRK92333.1 hypothetical protein FC99_GL000486 [Levilactobacillus koreensis JCM 16448]
MVVIPKVTDVQVIPVAGYDSMLLTLSGAHYPYFTRNIVIITDDSGNRGIGEIHGGDVITKSLNSFKSIIIGRPITEYRAILK